MYYIYGIFAVDTNAEDQKANVDDEPSASTKLMATVETDEKKIESENAYADNVLKLSSIVSDVPPSAIITATTVVENLRSPSEGEPESDDEKINLKLHVDHAEEISDKEQAVKGFFFSLFFSILCG